MLILIFHLQHLLPSMLYSANASWKDRVMAQSNAVIEVTVRDLAAELARRGISPDEKDHRIVPPLRG